jgi:hypothetical protein
VTEKKNPPRASNLDDHSTSVTNVTKKHRSTSCLHFLSEYLCNLESYFIQFDLPRILMPSEPLPPSVAELLSNRSKLCTRLPIPCQMAWRHSLLQAPSPIQPTTIPMQLPLLPPRHALRILLRALPIRRYQFNNSIPERARILLEQGFLDAR